MWASLQEPKSGSLGRSTGIGRVVGIELDRMITSFFSNDAESFNCVCDVAFQWTLPGLLPVSAYRKLYNSSICASSHFSYRLDSLLSARY